MIILKPVTSFEEEYAALVKLATELPSITGVENVFNPQRVTLEEFRSNYDEIRMKVGKALYERADENLKRSNSLITELAKLGKDKPTFKFTDAMYRYAVRNVKLESTSTS